jgi:signal transduction histidine kinase
MKLPTFHLPGRVPPFLAVPLTPGRRWDTLSPGELARGERITEVARWIFLIFLLLNNHLSFPRSDSVVIAVDVAVGIWAVGNFVITVLLLRGFQPHRYFSYGTTFFDLAIATSLYYLTGGFASSGLSVMFFLLIIAASVRFGLEASIVTALVVSLVYLLAGTLAGAPHPPEAPVIIGRLVVFNFIAVISGILVRDLRHQLDRAVRNALINAQELDATRRREALERERVQRLAELDLVKTDFVAIVAHELQTPIASIKTQAETLLGEHPRLDAPTRTTLLQGISKSATQLAQLVHDFSSVNRIDARAFNYHFERMDLQRFIEETVRAVPFDPKRHQLRVRVDAGMQVMADPRRLQEALGNLVQNAIKYSPRGGNIAVFGHARASGQAEIAVHDEGIGIRVEDRDKLFQKFRRIWDARGAAVGGTGLGLYIAKSIVEAHGGTISVESRWGKGSTFTITLPLLREGQGRLARAG